MNESPIAQNVRSQRELRHWTQEELSMASGVDVRTIQRSEGGRPLALESLKALAAAFNTTPDALSTSPQDKKLMEEEFRKNYSIVDLQPFDRTTDVRNVVGTGAFQFQRIGGFSDVQADALAELEQEFQDADMWTELGAIQ